MIIWYYTRSFNRYGRVTWIIILLLILQLKATADPLIKSGSSYFQEGMLHTNAELSLHLQEELKQAIRYGIPLYLEIVIHLVAKGSLGQSIILGKWEHEYKISHHGFTNRFILASEHSSSIWASSHNFEDLIRRQLGEYSVESPLHPIVSENPLLVTMTIRINKDKLPPALRIHDFFVTNILPESESKTWSVSDISG